MIKIVLQDVAEQNTWITYMLSMIFTEEFGLLFQMAILLNDISWECIGSFSAV